MAKQTSSGGASGGFGKITSKENAKAAMASLREETPISFNKHEVASKQFENKDVYRNEFPGLGIGNQAKSKTNKADKQFAKALENSMFD